MYKVQRILFGRWQARALCTAGATVMLAACGQRGPLYLPTEPAAANRATLPQVLIPGRGPTAPAPAPKPGASQARPGGAGTGTAAPVRQP